MIYKNGACDYKKYDSSMEYYYVDEDREAKVLNVESHFCPQSRIGLFCRQRALSKGHRLLVLL